MVGGQFGDSGFPPYLFYGSLRHVLSKYEVYEAMCIWEACLLMGVRTIYRNSSIVFWFLSR